MTFEEFWQAAMDAAAWEPGEDVTLETGAIGRIAEHAWNAGVAHARRCGEAKLLRAEPSELKPAEVTSHGDIVHTFGPFGG